MRYAILNSGGLDSALLAAKLHADGHELHSITIDTWQANRAGILPAAMETANRFCVSHKAIEVNLGQTSDFYFDATSGKFTMWDAATEEDRTGFHGGRPSALRLSVCGGYRIRRDAGFDTSVFGYS